MEEASVCPCSPIRPRRSLTFVDLQSPSLERDHLSTHPRETLATIFDLVYKLYEDKQMLGAIGRSLLPYTRQNQLKKVRIKSYRQLELLVEGAAELGEFIEELSVVMGPASPGPLLPVPGVEELSPSKPSSCPSYALSNASET